MNQPEYILEDSAKIALTAKQLANLLQSLTMVEVDLVVLSKELTLLAGMSTRIGNSLRELEVSLSEQELQD